VLVQFRFHEMPVIRIEAFSALSRYYSLIGDNIPDEVNAGAADRPKARRVTATLNCEWCTYSHAAALVTIISAARGASIV
jgi:hypothetical protein